MNKKLRHTQTGKVSAGPSYTFKLVQFLELVVAIGIMLHACMAALLMSCLRIWRIAISCLQRHALAHYFYCMF
eukprot:2522674-Amphidinium_carterae.1